MCNMKALSLLVERLYPRLGLLYKDGQTGMVIPTYMYTPTTYQRICYDSGRF